MSIKIMNSVWSSKLPDSISKNKRSTVKIVLLKLADNANDNGKCWPSIPRIAHETELSERSVIRALDDLKESNLIHVNTHRKNGVKHNTYYINTPLIDSLRLDFESVKSEENDNPFTSPSDNLSNPSDTLSKINDRMAVKPPLTINESSNTDISKADERVFLEDIKFDYDLRFCQEAIEQLRHINKLNYCRSAYDGSLALREWQDCEDVMRSIDDFDFEYFTWWMETRSQSMNKKPSLPNMLCYMNETTFEQFYNSTFMQEADL